MSDVLQNRGSFENIAANLKSAAFISFLLVLPFMILELWFQIINKSTAVSLKHYTDFVALFGLLWLLPTAFIFLLLPVMRNARAGHVLTANPALLFLRVAFLLVIAVLWGSVMIDQLGCFVGVPNCD